jgi:anti-repressor protein
VADKFGKLHKDVLRAVRGIEMSAEFAERNFAPSEYRDTTGHSLPLY